MMEEIERLVERFEGSERGGAERCCLDIEKVRRGRDELG